jgi:protein transport protein SEC61 subunit gamma-like protein
LAKEKKNKKNIKNSKNKDDKINHKIDELKAFIQQCRRVLIITRKPTRDEFINVSKVTGLGICLLGAIGFAIHVPIMYIKGLLKP